MSDDTDWCRAANVETSSTAACSVMYCVCFEGYGSLEFSYKGIVVATSPNGMDATT